MTGAASLAAIAAMTKPVQYAVFSAAVVLLAMLLLTETYEEVGIAAIVILIVWLTVNFLGATPYTALLLLTAFFTLRMLLNFTDVLADYIQESEWDSELAVVVVDALLSDDSSSENEPDP